MLWLVLVFVACASARPQQIPTILSHKQQQSIDGTYGFQFVGSNGLGRAEVQDANGARKGSYFYVDENGKKVTVNYIADEKGYRAFSDIIPQGPPAPAAPTPNQIPQQTPTFTPQNNQPVPPFSQFPAGTNVGQSQPSFNPPQNFQQPRFNQQNFSPQPQRQVARQNLIQNTQFSFEIPAQRPRNFNPQPSFNNPPFQQQQHFPQSNFQQNFPQPFFNQQPRLPQQNFNQFPQFNRPSHQFPQQSQGTQADFAAQQAQLRQLEVQKQQLQQIISGQIQG